MKPEDVSNTTNTSKVSRAARGAHAAADRVYQAVVQPNRPIEPEVEKKPWLAALLSLCVVGACQLDYSLLNRAPEKDVLPYCLEHNVGTLIRGPLAKGVLSGKFTADSQFDDSVRQGWNEGGGRESFLRNLQRVEQLRFLAQGRSMTHAALQYVLAHPAVTCAIPGAKSPEQIAENAAAADGRLTDEELAKARSLSF